MKTLVIVLLILTVFLLVPLGIDGGYKSERLILGIRVGFFNIRILPKKEKPDRPKIRRKVPKPKREKATGKGKSKKPLDKKELIGLIKAALRALGRLRRKLNVEYLRIRYTFASSDPFNSAIGFGVSSAAIYSVLPLIDNAFDIEKRDIGTSFDFLSDKPTFECWITMTIQVWEAFYVAIAFGIDFLKLKIKRKREHRK